MEELCTNLWTIPYLAGRGTGSSYIAELYQDFGYTGIILGAWGLMMMCSVIFYSFPAELYKSKGIPQMLFL